MIEPAAKNSWATPALLGVIGLAIGVFAGMKLAPQKSFEIGGQPALQFMAQNRFVSKEMYDSQRGFLIDVDNKLKNNGAIDFAQWVELLQNHRFAFACTDGPCHEAICCNGVNVAGYFVPIWGGPTCYARITEVHLNGSITASSCTPSGWVWDSNGHNGVFVKTDSIGDCGLKYLILHKGCPSSLPDTIWRNPQNI